MHQPTDSFSLTASQLAIWTGQSLQPNEPLYNMALAFQIDGPVDARAFADSFRRVVADCDALRAVFRTVDGLPRQVFLDDAPALLEVLERERAGSNDEQLEQWLKERTRRNFDVSQCLYDSVLLHANSGSIWYFNQHHLITDAWSVSVIFRRMAAYYSALTAGSHPMMTSAPAFSEQIEREAGRKGSKLHAAADRYWADRLERPLQLPRFYRDIPATRSATTLRGAIDVDAAVSERIRQLPKQPEFAALTEDLGRFQVFCTALTAYLWRVCGSDSLAIGTPSLNRSSQRLKQMAGLMIEMFPVQVDVAPDETFRSLYAKVADSTRGMLMHAPPGLADARHNRAFNVVLNYINASFGDFAGLKVRSEWIHPDCGDRNHLLRMQVHDFDQSGNFEVFLDLNSDAFSSQEREWVGRHFLRLLNAFVADPDQKIGSVPLTTKGEAGWPLVAAAETARPANVIDAFMAQSVATPDAAALIDGQVTWSYAQLYSAARAVQSQLQEVQPDNRSPVAVMMRRSPELVAAILGTMLARRPYVPIDPDYPADRALWVVADSGAALVLTSPGLSAAGLPDSVHQIEISLGAEAFQEAPPTQSGISAEDTAYIIYTSGSTGKPKGVLVRHDSLAHYVGWAAAYYFAGQPLGMALFSSIAFDLTVTSMFTPLVCGGHMVVYAESGEAGDIVVRRVVEDNRVDIIKLTPAHLSLLQSMDLSQSRIKTLVLGGEDLKTGLARTISNYFNGAVKIYNEYGPTEATVACMIHRFDPETDRDISVPIGQAIDHARIYVLDMGLNPQPRGIAGQIFIGGAGVAAGYLNRPELTAERFIVDPFEAGGRMYATGDLGRWDEQGKLRFLGRLDDQVKIRGVRIEPGEIETVMKNHTGIAECAVVARDRAMAGMSTDESFCSRCGLEGRHPQAEIDEEGVCRICRQFEREQHIASAYFRTMDELTALVANIKAGESGKYDSMMLLSGGKDSTYALCRLVDMGLRPLVFTLDNGYISAGAKQNMQRAVDRLGLDLIIGNTPAMNAIFADSLKRFSNVCEGCFKTIYTLSTKLASEHGIRHIFTGLSRGQIFQTRVADLIRQKITDPQQIDRQIIEARKAYHRLDDVVSRSMDVALFASDDVFEQIQFVDFYRYCDVSLGEVYDYLGTRAPWVRPADTGRSTNCLINEAGIYVHKVQRGHHNYSLPYSWDVRLGHKERDAARQELDDDIDEQNVRRILGEVGYVPDIDPAEFNTDTYLTAYYTGTAVDDADLQRHLAERLPAEYVPRFFVHLNAMPLTANGKLDRSSLPEPVTSSSRRMARYAAPETTTQKVLARIWSNVLGLDKPGIDENFFDLGGDSILNIQIVARARKYGLELSPQLIFDKPTIRELATAVVRRWWCRCRPAKSQRVGTPNPDTAKIAGAGWSGRLPSLLPDSDPRIGHRNFAIHGGGSTGRACRTSCCVVVAFHRCGRTFMASGLWQPVRQRLPARHAGRTAVRLRSQAGGPRTSA